MELEGNLGEFSIYSVIQFLRQGKLDGTLVLSEPRHSAFLVIRQGKVVGGADSFQPQRMVNLIDRSVRIKRKIVSEIRGEAKTLDGNQFGQMLVKNGHLPSQKWTEISRVFVEEHIRDLALWTQGKFHFERDSTDSDASLLVEVDPDSFISEHQQLDEDTRLFLESYPRESSSYGVRSIKKHELAGISLSWDEWYILSFLNGSSAFRTILEQSHLGRLSTWRTLSHLLQRNLVQHTGQADEENLEQISKIDIDLEQFAQDTYDPDDQEESLSDKKKFGGIEPVFGRWMQMLRRRTNSVDT